MKQILLLCGALLLLTTPALAKKVYDIELPETATVAGETLQLNGYGLRKKFFFKIYLGSLYTAQPAASTEQALNQPTAKLIRMDFIYDKVEREKIVAAFAEGLEKNSPELASQQSAKQFLQLFDADFRAGDQVELQLTAAAVSATHNGRALGTIRSPELARGVLLIYLGDQPADRGLKAGMLGQN